MISRPAFQMNHPSLMKKGMMIVDATAERVVRNTRIYFSSKQMGY